MLNRRDFYHQNIKYSFHYHQDRLNTIISTNKNFIKLEQFFRNVYEGNIPNHIFNTREYPRVSNFKMKGIKKTFLMSYGKKLIRSNKINKYESNNPLSSYVQQVFNSYKKNDIRKKPNHDPILKNILIKDPNTIAIEVPIWKNYNKHFITGHIDLVQIIGDTIRIIDYKPEGNFLNSLPQVATYGLLFKTLFKYSKLKCVSFNIHQAWEYDPNILITDIMNYLKLHRIETRRWEKFLHE